MRERVAHSDAPVHGTILQIFREQHGASLHLGGAHDQAVPPTQPMAEFDLAPALQQCVVDGLGPPCEQRNDVFPGHFR